MGFLGTVVWILTVICAILLIVDVWTKNKKMPQGTKILWTVGAIIPWVNIAVIIVYYFVVKNK